MRLYLFKHYYTINNDGVLYIEAARDFWQGDWFKGLASFYPPLFPWLIAVAYPLVGEWELAGQFWPLVLGLAVFIPLYATLRRFYGARVAHVSLVLYAVSPYLARLSIHVRSEIPYLFFFLLALYFFQRGFSGQGRLFLLLTGVSAALSYLIRPEGMGLVIVGVPFLLYRGWLRSRLREASLNLIPLVLGFFLVAFPYVLYLKGDTGSWQLSRKTTFIVALGMAEHDPSVSLSYPEGTSALSVITERPQLYAKKVAVDLFRAPAVYFEALHYSYIPFLLIGLVLFFRDRFWKRDDLFFLLYILFHFGSFALLHVNRRNALPLVTVSFGWVAAGYLVLEGYFRGRWGGKGTLFTALIVALFFAATLPKALREIGREKLYLREAGVYLRGKAGGPTIITTDTRVSFYARGENRVLIKDLRELTTGTLKEGDFLALDKVSYGRVGTLAQREGWRLDRVFFGGPKESLFVLRRGREQ